jgi:hypothetical protein
MKVELSNVTGYLVAFLQFLVVKDGKLTDYHKKILSEKPTDT